MATFKVTAQLGKVDLKDVVVSAGSAEAQSDTISLNVDWTNLNKGQLLILLKELEQKIFNLPFPPL